LRKANSLDNTQPLDKYAPKHAASTSLWNTATLGALR
jgi:hypothetical protein